MVPSPRKRATRQTFDQTWDVTDTAFLDPNTLPVARIPRGWERRQETKKTEEGKEKKIWRRFNLRSRASDADEIEQEQEHDARSRPVKKLQQMSPKAMESSGSRRNGRQRAFKATRWDRRKSVLPRKRVGLGDVAADTLGQEEEEDETLESNDTGEDSIMESAQDTTATEPTTAPLIAEGDRRATFSFVLDTLPNEVNHSSQFDTEDMDDIVDARPMGDDTISNLFKSPVKHQSKLLLPLADEVQYPQLPMDEDAIVLMEASMADRVRLEDITTRDQPVQEEVQEHLLKSEVAQTSVVASFVADENQAIAPEPVSFGAGTPQKAVEEVMYPTLSEELDSDTALEIQAEAPSDLLEAAKEDEEMSEDSADEPSRESIDDISIANAVEEELTEASLQLDMQQELEEADSNSQAREEPSAVEEHTEPQVHDITDGLTLSFTPQKTISVEAPPKKLHSPPPQLQQPSTDDVTMTIAMDDDTALLKNFLTRAAASKAEKAAVLTHRRESLQNRRDSDVIRHALASPRKALENKDPNSPSKYDTEATLDLSQTLTLSVDKDMNLELPDAEDAAEELTGHGSRRSSRAKKSRLPAPASVAQTQASKIAIRRQDGTEHVVLKKTDAQELATITRANTRKNKQGAFVVSLRLLKLIAEAANLPPVDDSSKELVVGKNVRWDEQLNYYQENPETVAERVSLETPDELSMGEASSSPRTKPKSKVSKNSTPKIRRVRGLGSTNGTPGKGLLAPASLLPEAVQEEKEPEKIQPTVQQIPRPKSSKIKKMLVASSTEVTSTTVPSETKLPSLEVGPVGVEAPKERKSRLAAPKRVTLPQPVAAVATAEKENTQRSGIAAATPKKGIPAPKVIAAPKVIVPPTVGMESGLPRRRGRKI